MARENGHTVKWKNINLKTCLYCITSVIILLGLGSALLIYLTAENDEDSISGYELPSLENSKRYVHAMELYGGKANVLAEEFRSWFVGLWHGKSLAFTIACITIFISIGLIVVANHLPSDLKDDLPTGECDTSNK
jgi:hypothetical protein